MIIATSTEQDRILYIDFKANKHQKKTNPEAGAVCALRNCLQAKVAPLGTGASPLQSPNLPTSQKVTVPLPTILLWELTNADCMRGKIMRAAIPRNPEHDY